MAKKINYADEHNEFTLKENMGEVQNYCITVSLIILSAKIEIMLIFCTRCHISSM